MNGYKPAKILCIDDEPLGLSLRKALLEHAGYCVYAAGSGDEALRLFATESIDLVITDELLPGVTGSRLAMLMKLSHPEIPIVILSGLAEEPEYMGIADSFLCKGEPPPILLATVARLVSGKTAASAECRGI